VKLGALIEWDNDLSTFRRQCRLADELGYDVIGAGDTPARAYEMYVSLTVAAHERARALLSPAVTTPYLRHPVATATAISTLNVVSGGRVMLVVGNGGSAPRIVGRPVGATQQQVREYVLAVREILNGGSAHVDGRDTEPLERVVPMPIHIAADYPASLRMAGEVADGVVTTVGMSLEAVEHKVATVREAAEKAGRDPEAIEIWGFSFVSIQDDQDEANADIAAALASDIGLRLKAAHRRATIPPELVGAVEELERRYDLFDHVPGGKNADLIRELGLVDFAAGRTAVTGSVSDVAEHLKRLESVGVAGLFAPTIVLADPETMLRRLREAAGLS